MKTLLGGPALGALAVLGLAAAGPQRSAPPTFSIAISTPTPIVRAGAKILVRAVMTNISDHDIYYGVGGGIAVFDVEVRDATRHLAPEKPLGRRLRQGPQVIVSVIMKTLHPGKSLDSASDVTERYDLTKPGRYTIQFQRTDPLTRVLVKSNTISITVVRQ